MVREWVRKLVRNEKCINPYQITAHLSRRLRPPIKDDWLLTGEGEIFKTKSTGIIDIYFVDDFVEKRKVQKSSTNTRTSLPKTPAPIKDRKDGNGAEKF